MASLDRPRPAGEAGFLGGSAALADAVLAALVAGYALLEIWLPAATVGVSEPVGNRFLLTLTGLVITVPLAVRRRWPLAAAATSMAGVAAQSFVATPVAGLSTVVAVGVLSYSV